MQLVLLLLLMLVLPFLNVGMAKRKNTRLSVFYLTLLTGIMFYIISLGWVLIEGQWLWFQYMSYDINGDGLLQDSEYTLELELIEKQIFSDTARSFAPFTLAMLSFIYMFVVGACYSYWIRINQKHNKLLKRN